MMIKQGIEQVTKMSEDRVNRLEEKLDKIDNNLDTLNNSFTKLQANFENLYTSYKELKSYAYDWRQKGGGKLLELKGDISQIRKRLEALEALEKKRHQISKSFKRRFWNIVEKVIYGVIIFGIGILFERISNI